MFSFLILLKQSLSIKHQSNVKLADILPIESKKGHYIAEACFEACELKGVLNVNVINDKVVGITGDGLLQRAMNHLSQEHLNYLTKY